MGMSATTTQIVELVKRGFEAEQIASALGLSLENVMAVMTKDVAAVKEIYDNTGDRLDAKFAKLEDLAMKGLEHLASYAENEETRRKTYEFIIKQRAGLMKPRERVTVQNNYQFLSERVDKAKQLRDATVIDINAKVVQQ
tara:strand:+ start:22669 stop:23088 length:420 start_codon:yes stop_codon:yes gene_type:complete